MSDKMDNKNQRRNDDEARLVDIFKDENIWKSGKNTEYSAQEHIDDDDDLIETPFDDEDEIEERDYMPIRFRRDGKVGCLGGLMYAVFVISLSIICACGAWMAAADVLALNKEYKEATLTLPKDIFTKTEVEVKDEDGIVTGTKEILVADIDYVTDVLKDNGLIEYKWLFKLYAGISNADKKVDAGTYNLSTNLDYRALVKGMTTASESMVVSTLMFPEGYTMEQIFTKLEENDICSKEDLYEAAANYNYKFEYLSGMEAGDASRLEGFIFPNTYDFYQGEQASSVIYKFLEALHYQITADMLKQCENRGITFREAVTIASMIEKEAANNEERTLIASVIYNRLDSGMTLGLDATVLYVHPEYSGGIDIPMDILSEDSPYNTHIYTGLTPTPICNPGMASIKAALQPADTNYYYYALNTETGTHEFFTKKADFDAFVATQDYGNTEE